jgi:broad specificity phosphatase PhoE
MKKTFYLIRHGNKERIDTDPALTHIGREQAKKTGKHLKNLPISRIIASPMLRTRQTAEYIADELSLNYETNELLRERMEYSPTVYKSIDEYIETWNYHTKNRMKIPKYGDSAYAAGQRIHSVISSLQNEKDEHIVLVSHGGTILDYLTNTFAPEPMNTHVPGYITRQFQEILVHECSITTVGSIIDTYEFVSFGYCDHLA